MVVQDVKKGTFNAEDEEYVCRKNTYVPVCILGE
jgi:hypothetical protein